MIAYFDCFSGISGDMTLGALVDLGVPVDYLKDEIRKNLIDGFDLKAENKVVCGISATDVSVLYDGKDHHGRDYKHIKKLISGSSLSENVKNNALSMFARIAKAESKIHGTDIENTHFHEVGSVDAIVDIVGVCLGINYLKIDKVYASSLPLGSGFVNCSHGTLPVPAPATLEILRDVPVTASDIESELVTPTGAAIISTLCKEFRMPDFVPSKIGYGSGKKRFEDKPNLLRIITGEDKGVVKSDRVYVLETLIDDMNPEIFGYLMERLFEDGVLDLYYTSVYMKKNRPGIHLTAIVDEGRKNKIIDRILSETTSTGVRISETKRAILPRRIVQVETSFGKLSFKEITKPDGKIILTPEYEELRRVARAKNLPLKTVYDTVLKESDRLL